MADTPDIRPVGDLPDAIGKTAARELSGAGITSLEQVAAHTEKDLLAIHGVGPKAIRILGESLAERGLTFAHAPEIDPERFRADTDGILDQDAEPRT